MVVLSIKDEFVSFSVCLVICIPCLIELKLKLGDGRQMPADCGYLFEVTTSKVKGHIDVNLPKECPLITKSAQQAERSALLWSQAMQEPSRVNQRSSVSTYQADTW